MTWGEEAVIDVPSFTLEGRAIRKVRQSVQRLERAGYTVRFVTGDRLDAPLRSRLERINRAWLAGRRVRGFTLEMDSPFGGDATRALYAIAVDAAGEPRGFLHFARCAGDALLSLSTMPREPNTPNGLNEWLVCAAIDWARRHRIRSVSLNFAPFADLLSPGASLRGARRISREALLALKSRLQLQLDNLITFNRKFLPRWERRFIVFERRADLPRIGLAALSAEGVLPAGRDA